MSSASRREASGPTDPTASAGAPASAAAGEAPEDLGSEDQRTEDQRTEDQRTGDQDAQLMLLVGAGDRAAFEELFRRYTPPLLGFLSRMVPELGRAEELAQETFVRVYEARERYEPRARFSTWLFGIARNLALNDLDRAHRKRERSFETAGRDDWQDPAPGADAELDARRTHARLELALQKLPERQRAALLLRTREDLGYQDIAEALGTSVSSVKSLLHRARERLFAELETGAETGHSKRAGDESSGSGITGDER